MMPQIIWHRRRKRTMGYAGRIVIVILFLLLSLVILSGCSCRDYGYCPYKVFPNSKDF